ncbi:Vacuolar amino acid transporter 3 [Tolypocladium paradoxum]|uniref:Vacuolar amino acid transporter 3 n=1 Tax=Tolypocladium paradoxum TaxID=94208 RepID=A0A2S4L8G7_9HYPO|nr:Vacuolar amino acid transporter 3 [Tolypocladium paradoxum]
MRRGTLAPSGDALDLGMGLWMCQFVADEPWAADLRDQGLRLARRVLAADSGLMRRGAAQRLAFREFGACLGVACASEDDDLKERVDAVVEFWERRLEEDSDVELRPISLVMYSAALIPGGRSHHLEAK